MADVKIIPARDRSGDVIRTAAYARVSSDSDDQINSFSAQIQYYTEYLSGSADMAFVDMYADEGLSGTGTAKRNDFNRLMNDCRKGKIDRILTKSVSRFARNTKDCLEAIRELKQLGISVYFEKEDIDTGEISSELMLTLYSQFAQEESISISKNVRMGIHKRMADGTYKNGSMSFGYEYINGEIRINAEKSEIIKQIYIDYLNGMGLIEIAHKLNRNGIKPPEKAQKWYPQIIHNIISNERYIGDMLLQKKYMTDTLPFTKVRNYGEREQYYVESTHEAIIDKETFEKVQQLRREKSRKFRRAASDNQCTFRKIIYCGHCGTLYKRKEHGVYWVCRKHDESAENCPARQIPESELQSAFVRMFNKMTAAQSSILPPMIRQLQELADRKTAGNSHITDIRKEIADTKEQIHITAALKTEGIIDEAYFTARNKEFDVKLLALQKQLRALSDNEKDDEQITELKQLTEIFGSSEPLTEFDDIKFAETVSRITVISETEIRFTLCGGVEFSEKIERKGRR